MTTSTLAPGTAQVRSAVISGGRAELIQVQVQATVGTGPPSFTVTGICRLSVSRDAARAAQPAC